MSSFTLYFHGTGRPAQKANGGRWSRCRKSFRSACLVRVCVSVCEFGEPSADAGSLGHLASAKEKEKLLQWVLLWRRWRWRRRGGESKLFGAKESPVLFCNNKEGGKSKSSRGGGIIALVYRANASLEPRLFVVLPISPLSRKNVFLSPRTSDGVECATGERGRGKKTSSLSLRYVFLQTNRSCCASKWHLWRRSVAFVAAQNQEMGTFFSLF